MTNQELFDTVAVHLLKQNESSVDEGGGCLYRSGDLKCAVGVLIPDELYSSDIEGISVGKLYGGAYFISARKKVTDWLFTTFSENQIKFLTELQDIHDDGLPSEWRELLERLAINHGLSTSALDSVEVPSG